MPSRRVVDRIRQGFVVVHDRHKETRHRHELRVAGAWFETPWSAGNGKRECRAGSIIVLCPETTVMSLDNCAADGQPDTHPATLRGVKGIEDSVHVLTAEANPGIPYGQAHVAVVLAFGLDQQMPRALLNVGHCVRGIAEQIQDDLLELNTIPGHQRHVSGELRLHDHAISLKIVQ